MNDLEAHAEASRTGDAPATLEYYARLLARRWWLPLSFLVLGVSLALVYTGLQTTAYAARSTILLSPLDPATADELPQLAPTVAGLVRSDAVLLEARRSYAGGRFVGLDDLSSRTSVRVPRDTSLFEVTAEGPTQQDATSLVRAVVAAAIRQIARLGGAQARGPGQPAQLRVAVLGPPIPEGRVSPTPTRNLVLGANLGILLGIIAALLLRDPQRARVRADLLARLLETPDLVYAQLPRTRGAEQLTGVATSVPRVLDVGSNGRKAEGIRLLGGRLAQWFQQDCRTVLLLGDLPPQTLRSVSLRLAAHLARTGLDPVVIEADFHGSAWRSHAGDQHPGLGEALERPDAEPEVMVVETTQNGAGPSPVTIVPRGRVQCEPAVLFASDQYRSLIEDFLSRGHVVLVIGPPTEYQSEVLALADAADGVVLLVPPWIPRSRVACMTTLRNTREDKSLMVSVFGEPDALPLALRFEWPLSEQNRSQPSRRRGVSKR